MKQFTMAILGLTATLATSSAQDQPGHRDPQMSQPVMTGWVVRVYLMDMNKKDVDLKDVTATLMVEERLGTPQEKPMAKKTIPMTMVMPKPEEKLWGWRKGQLREVQGGPYWCEMMVMKSSIRGTEKGTEDREKSGKGAYDRGTEGAPEKGQEGVARAHTGAYFKADVPADAAPRGEWTASVTFKIKNETKTVTGFQYPWMEKESDKEHKESGGYKK